MFGVLVILRWTRVGERLSTAFFDGVGRTGLACFGWPVRRNSKREHAATRRFSRGRLRFGSCWGSVRCHVTLLLLVKRPSAYRFTDAVFESMSGLTTTGARRFSTGLDELPQRDSLLPPAITMVRRAWASSSLAVAVLPMLGVGGHAVVPRRNTRSRQGYDNLTPRITETAKALLVHLSRHYGSLRHLPTALAGMTVFDAICHSVQRLLPSVVSPPTMLSIWATSQSPLIEMIAVVFMFVVRHQFLVALRWGGERGACGNYLFKDLGVSSAYVRADSVALTAFVLDVSLRCTGHYTSSITETVDERRMFKSFRLPRRPALPPIISRHGRVRYRCCCCLSSFVGGCARVLRPVV